MLSAIEISEEKWEEYWSQIKVYRDKDLAHIEARNISMIPSMEIAINSTAFYYSKIQYALAELGRAPQRQMSFFDILDVYTKQFEQQAEIALIATGTLRNA